MPEFETMREAAGQSPPDLGALYRDTRMRVTDLVLSIDAESLAAPVPACPEWSVADVVYHLVAGAEDVLAGRLTGPPSDAHTASQVRRHRGKPMVDMTSRWTDLAVRLEPLIAAGNGWPVVIDVVSHEHDIRGAVGRPGERDSAAVHHSADALCRRAIGVPVPIRVVWENGEGRLGSGVGPELVLHTSRFETVRWRLGRRSRAQMRQFDWTGDAIAVIAHLAVFGPTSRDIIE
jgi:uncharacterized protein (TIGR03083 family)